MALAWPLELGLIVKNSVMKTSTKILFTVCTVVGLSLSAQPRMGGNDPRHQNNQNNNNNQNNTSASSNNNWNDHSGDNKRGGHVTIQIGGGYPNNYYGNNYGYSYSYNNCNYGYGNNWNYGYNNNGYYNVKRAARNSINQSAGFIGQALQFSDWNDAYSPWLAKAISHQQYAKQLYFWGDYAGALNHAERAGFLAWNTLSYFNNGYGYNNPTGNGYPDPYGNPNNPYYRQNNSNTQPNTTTNPDAGNDYGYRKNQSTDTQNNTNINNTPQVQKADMMKLDETLPQNKMSDRELLKVNPQDLSVE